MTSGARTEEEMTVIVNDLIRDIEEQKEALKAQAEQVSKVQEGQKELYQKIELLEAGFTSRAEELSANKTIDIVAMEVVVKQGLEVIKEEVKKQHTVIYQTKHYSVFSHSFRVEHFSLVVNTVMKWVVILIGVFFVIRMVAPYTPS